MSRSMSHQTMTRDSWHARAACHTTPNISETWWYEVDIEEDPTAHLTNLENSLRAKLVCATCPVRAQCREAGEDEMYGIWGGLTARERKAIRTGKPLELRGRRGVDADGVPTGRLDPPRPEDPMMVRNFELHGLGLRMSAEWAGLLRNAAFAAVVREIRSRIATGSKPSVNPPVTLAERLAARSSLRPTLLPRLDQPWDTQAPPLRLVSPPSPVEARSASSSQPSAASSS